MRVNERASETVGKITLGSWRVRSIRVFGFSHATSPWQTNPVIRGTGHLLTRSETFTTVIVLLTPSLNGPKAVLVPGTPPRSNAEVNNYRLSICATLTI